MPRKKNKVREETAKYFARCQRRMKEANSELREWTKTVRGDAADPAERICVRQRLARKK